MNVLNLYINIVFGGIGKIPYADGGWIFWCVSDRADDFYECRFNIKEWRITPMLYGLK